MKTIKKNYELRLKIRSLKLTWLKSENLSHIGKVFTEATRYKVSQ